MVIPHWVTNREWRRPATQRWADADSVRGTITVYWYLDNLDGVLDDMMTIATQLVYLATASVWCVTVLLYFA